MCRARHERLSKQAPDQASGIVRDAKDGGRSGDALGIHPSCIADIPDEARGKPLESRSVLTQIRNYREELPRVDTSRSTRLDWRTYQKKTRRGETHGKRAQGKRPQGKRAQGPHAHGPKNHDGPIWPAIPRTAR